ncbi:FHA domain-containing protein [Modestobacter sp. I12A-02662]|uniref:FHA domain-containing protein n=1 Tax=Modestobacter sp. I12A-02662 TaxID=1730496 RepID=UPI0034DE8E9A
MSVPLAERPSPALRDWPRVQVHPGTGVVDRRGDVLLVVPVLPPSSAERVRELVRLCHRPDPTGSARVDALRALLDLRAADVPGFALLVRSGTSLRALVHRPVRLLVDGRAPDRPAGDGARLGEHVLPDGDWHELTVAAEGDAELPAVSDVLRLDLESGTVPGAGVTLLPTSPGPVPQLPGGSAAAGPGIPSSATALRPAVQFRTVLLGECATAAGQPARAARRPPLPIAGARGEGGVDTATTGPEVLVEGVHCPQGHFTDPELPACPTCGTPLPPAGRRVRLPRPPLGILVTDGGTIYPVTGDLLIGREAAQAPDVLAGRARALPLRDAARSTSRVHARLTVDGWTVLLSDNGSANGTFLSRSGAAGPWLPVTAQIPVRLVHGDRVRLGKRQLLFDTWRETAVSRGPR